MRALYLNSGISEDWPDAGEFLIPPAFAEIIRHGLDDIVVPGKKNFRTALAQAEPHHIYLRVYYGSGPDGLGLCDAMANLAEHTVTLQFNADRLHEFDHVWMESWVRALIHFLAGIPDWTPIDKATFEKRHVRETGLEGFTLP